MKKSMILLFLVVLAGMLLADGEIVSSEVIEEIAQRAANAWWGDVATGEVIPYYYNDNKIIAYRYNFYKGEEFPDEPDLTKHDMFGTILLSTRKDMPVILEHSESLSHEYLLRSKLHEEAEKALGKGYEMAEAYYLSYSNIWYCVSKGLEKKYIKVLPPVKVLEEGEFNEFATDMEFFLERGDFSEEWDSYESGERELTRNQVLLVNHEYMPFYSWHDGCSPTAASMLLAWYDYNSINTWQNYSNLVEYHYK